VTPGPLRAEALVTLPPCFENHQYRCVSKKELPTVEVCAQARRTGPVLGADEAATLAARFKAVADPTRLRLLSLIAAHAEGEACVCDLTGEFALSGPTISHHLKVLREAGLITGERRGTWIYYRVVPETMAALSQALSPAHELEVTA
jgi:ArsR family transcriptional regulator, arsenate/arsenite/antimonite-responsive transcriptional repressor